MTTAGLLAVVIAAGTTATAAAQDPPAPQRPTPAELRAAPITVRDGLRFVAPPERLIEVPGIPTARRYLDTIELLPRRGGIDVVNELGLDPYLYGLAEVPQSWPEAVLDAQVIAARTYAWRSIQRSTSADQDICATVACQVFRGAEILLGPNGDRWRDAVDRTSGRVLLYEGEPILARYFSTSGGRTYANEEVFPSSGPRPYLRAFDDPFDALSPLHRWEVRFTREEFDTILAEGRTLSATVPVASVERLGRTDDPQAELRVTGEDGTEVTVRAIVLRDFLSTRAARLFPDRFPPLRADGLRPLPSTLPTTRYDIEVTDDEVVVLGQGWGHGVGMGQWGAHARALAGHSAEEILAAYYGGITPTVDPRLPDRIRAGMGSPRQDEDGAVRVTLHAPTRVVTTGRSAAQTSLGTSLGTWRIVNVDGVLRVTPPAGEDEPLAVSPTTAVPGVSWGPGRAFGTLHPGDADSTDLRITVNRPTLVRLVVTAQDGTVMLDRDLGLAERGLAEVRWFHDGGGMTRVPSGRYRAALVATDATGAVGGTDVEVGVRP
jgi:SpoIID/LytB domain protein